MPGLIIAAVVLGIPLLFVILTYNGLVALRNHIRDAWANIDTELKRRHDLIPNLVATVKGYAAHEQELFSRITELRSQCLKVLEQGRAASSEENTLTGAMRQMLGLVENYPQLKADQHFLKLQQQLVETEDRIQAARRFYNGNIRDYRNKCETFPSSLIAAMFGFEKQDYFQVESSVRECPETAF